MVEGVSSVKKTERVTRDFPRSYIGTKQTAKGRSRKMEVFQSCPGNEPCNDGEGRCLPGARVGNRWCRTNASVIEVAGSAQPAAYRFLQAWALTPHLWRGCSGPAN